MAARPNRGGFPGAGVLLLGILLALPACTNRIVGVPPSLEKKFVDHPAGSRISYRDEDASHVITLHEDGTYQFESADTFGVSPTVRNGQWSWRTGGTHKAELTLDRNKWILTFASPDSAVAVNTAAPGRTFAFQFERLNQLPGNDLALPEAW